MQFFFSLMTVEAIRPEIRQLVGLFFSGGLWIVSRWMRVPAAKYQATSSDALFTSNRAPLRSAWMSRKAATNTAKAKSGKSPT